jgi:hypothetical protein
MKIWSIISIVFALLAIMTFAINFLEGMLIDGLILGNTLLILAFLTSKR